METENDGLWNKDIFPSNMAILGVFYCFNLRGVYIYIYTYIYICTLYMYIHMRMYT